MILRKVNNLLSKIRVFINKRKFSHCGNNNRIFRPLKIDGYKNIYLENNILIKDLGWLYALKSSKENKPSLRISSNCEIGHMVHIVAINSIIIKDSVLTADKVFITDGTHNFDNISIPIREQGVKQLKDVVIGSGSWIGENVSILGASIGKQSIIGAGSVVVKDIPDYSIAVGNPAKVVKKYNFETKKWQSVD